MARNDYADGSESPQETRERLHRRKVTLLICGCALLLSIIALIAYDRRSDNRVATTGTIQATRVVVDHVVETRLGSQVTWKGQYEVRYTVGDRQYTVLGETGIKGTSEAEVQMSLRSPITSCSVRYDPNNPALAVAEC